jgi:hypothetical protein
LENKRLQEELNTVKHEKQELEKDIASKNITIQVLTEKNLHLNGEIMEMNQEIKRNTDIERQLAIANEKIQKLTESKYRC